MSNKFLNGNEKPQMQQGRGMTDHKDRRMRDFIVLDEDYSQIVKWSAATLYNGLKQYGRLPLVKCLDENWRCPLSKVEAFLQIQ